MFIYLQNDSPLKWLIHFISCIPQVSDLGVPPLYSTVDVLINILDHNDNAPVFDGAPFEVNVSENGPILQEVGVTHLLWCILSNAC